MSRPRALYTILFALLARSQPAAPVSLPRCNASAPWLGACTWPNTPPADCPLPLSTSLVDVSFSGRFGAYPSTAADTWFPSPGADGNLYTSFADGRVCTSTPPPPPLPSGYVELLWWWSAAAEDNVLTTREYPPDAAGGYTLVGVIGYGLAAAAAAAAADAGAGADADAGAGAELRLWRAPAGAREYLTTASASDEALARSQNYTLVASLGASLPAAAPPADPPLPATTGADMPAGVGPGWVATTLLYSASRAEYYSSPEAFLPAGYAAVSAQGRMNVQPPAAGACATGSGVSPAQGWAVLSGSDFRNLSVAAVGTVPHPPLNLSFPGVPPPYGVYPSSSFIASGVWVYSYYLLADADGAGCSNWCRLGPLLGFAVAPMADASAPPAWDVSGIPLWRGGGRGEARGVFEPLDVSAPRRLGVPRFADLGAELAHAPGGRAYLLGKGCARNDGAHCSFMTGDSAFLARTRAPFAALAANASAALNDAAAWEFSAGAGSGAWVPALADAAPLFAWPGAVGGLTLTYDAALAKFIVVSNLPGDRVHPTDCRFDTYILEADAIDGPYALVSYMAALGPQMYFQQAASAFWSADGLTGVLFSSGNWDGACQTQGSNPPGERYGLVTTEFAFVPAATARAEAPASE